MKKHLISGLVLAVAAVSLTGCSTQSYDGDHTGCTVLGKYSAYVNKTTQKRVETTCGVFVVDDSLLNGRFDSADTYASLQSNHTYDFVAKGVRIPFFSEFPNILSAQEVDN